MSEQHERAMKRCADKLRDVRRIVRTFLPNRDRHPAAVDVDPEPEAQVQSRTSTSGKRLNSQHMFDHYCNYDATSSSSLVASSNPDVFQQTRFSNGDREEAAIQAAIDQATTPPSSIDFSELGSSVVAQPQQLLEAIAEAPQPNRPQRFPRLRPIVPDPHAASYFCHEPSSAIISARLEVVDDSFVGQLTGALQVVAEYPFTHPSCRPAYGTQHSTPEPGHRCPSGLYRPPTTTVPPPSAATMPENEGRVELDEVQAP